MKENFSTVMVRKNTMRPHLPIMDADDAHRAELDRLKLEVKSLSLALAGMIDAYAPRARNNAQQNGIDSLQSDVRRALETLDATKAKGAQ